MDEKVTSYYRRLLREDFPNSGELENPSAFVEAVGGRLIHCGNTGNYMQLYLRAEEGRIVRVAYLCSCEPAANVAVEILCDLAKGKTLDEADALTEEPFCRLLETRDGVFLEKAVGLLELLREATAKIRSRSGAGEREGGERNGNLSWDDPLNR